MEYIRFRNPVSPHAADPWVIRDAEGCYYYCYSGGNGVCVSKISSPVSLSREGGTKVYTAPEGTAYSREYWAPELHNIGGRWYIYVAADDGDNYHHRMYVLRCTGDKPTDPFELAGKIVDCTDKWAIDGTVLQYGGEMYFIWSGWEGDENVAQNIYIAHMSDPYTIDSERVMLSEPEYDWELVGGMPKINEGPVALIRGDTVHIIYSASGSWCDGYCLGRLTLRGGDPMDPAAWEKSDKAAFSANEYCYGPGHCSFVNDDEGGTWVIYHGNAVSGTGWRGRNGRIQKISWDGDVPVFGEPAGPEDELVYPVK